MLGELLLGVIAHKREIQLASDFLVWVICDVVSWFFVVAVFVVMVNSLLPSNLPDLVVLCTDTQTHVCEWEKIFATSAR